MGEKISEAAAKMEKLELLSATALLKQGIDGATTSSRDDLLDGQVKNRNLETPLFGHATTTNTNLPSFASSPSSVASTMLKPIFSVASTASVTGLLMHETTSSAPALEGHCNSVKATHLPSPVSADGDDDVPNIGYSIKPNSADTKLATPSSIPLDTSVSTHSLQQLIESRSPMASVEYHRQQFVEAPTPPSSASYGYPLHPRYESAQAAFRPHMENSVFTVFGGGAHSENFAGTATDSRCYQQRQLPSPYHLSSPKIPSLGGIGGASGNKCPEEVHGSAYEEVVRELAVMQEQLKEKDMVVSTLQYRVNYLENEINELRQLPTGKISHIPVE
jgi:hypothetical protein